MIRLSPFDENLKILEPVLGLSKVRKLKMLHLFEDSLDGKRDIERQAEMLVWKHITPSKADYISLSPPLARDCTGEIPIGYAEHFEQKLHPFALKLKDINRHVGIYGSTGTGKTTLALSLLHQLHRLNIPFLVFDWEKSYRCLAKSMDGVQVLTFGSTINPVFLNFMAVPPGIDFDEYIKSLVTVISEDYIGGIGADTMLLTYMEMAFQETKNPIFEDLKKIIQREINKDKGRTGRLAGRSGLWKETVLRQMSFMSKGASGKVINTAKHLPIEKLFGKPLILEFGGMKSPHDRKFFIHVILNWLSIWCQHQGIIAEDLRQVLVFEEFHNIAMKGSQDNMVSNLFRESRKYGIGLVAIDQTPSEIPNSIFANQNVKVSFSLATRQDISAMAKAMTLQEESYLGVLKTGQAVINVKQRHPEPFVLSIERGPAQDYVSDEELKTLIRGSSDDLHINWPLSADSSLPQKPQDLGISPPLSHLDGLQRCFISDIIDHPFDGVEKRTKRLGLHPGQMKGLHESLEEKAIIKSEQFGNLKLFELTIAGREAAESANIKVPKQDGRGGIAHSYSVQQAMLHLKSMGLSPRLEQGDIDIVDTSASLAIEVETGKSAIAFNVAKLNISGMKNLFMLATSKEVEIKIKSLPLPAEKISIMTVRDFLKLSKQQILSQSHHDNEVSAITQ